MQKIMALIFLIFSATSGYSLDMNAVVNKSDGAVYMNLWGTIEHGDDQKFRSILLPYIKAGNILFKVNIFSVGGDVQAAMGIGDQIRTARGMTIGPMKMAQFIDRVAVPNGEVQCWFYTSMNGTVANNWPNHQIVRNIPANTGPRWCDCASACFLVWASGMARDGQWIGIHRFRFDEMFYGKLSPSEAKEYYAAAEKKYREFVRNLGIPENLVDRMFATPSTEMYYLTYDEYKLVSSTPYLEELVQARCGSSKATEYWEGNAHISTEDPVHIRCTRSIVEEAQRQGAREYLAKYGDENEVPAIVLPAQPALPEKVEQPVFPANSNKKSNIPTTYWNFYGSTMYLIGDGDMWNLYFDVPRPSFAERGIKHGSIFFQGSLKGNDITGVLKSYTKNCDVDDYPVKGKLSKDGHSAFVEGLRPLRDEQCRFKGTRKVKVEVYYDHGA